MMSGTEHVLLMSGGIGDFLHYLSRLPHFLSVNKIDPLKLVIYIESTAPNQVKSIFDLTFPELKFSYVPARLHWTKTNPLLIAYQEIDRINRPAYQYVLSQGFYEITDWFLPFLCSDYKIEQGPLLRLVSNQTEMAEPYIVVSVRDKGFLWWPTRETCEEIEIKVSPSYRLIYLGTSNESELLGDKVEQRENVAEALQLSYYARLFIGTDTGLATIRELTGRKNIYCINEYWLNELMINYKYINESFLKVSQSVFAYNQAQLLALVSDHLKRETSR
jgi:hypothetical protein